jgi:hypothetical protein
VIYQDFSSIERVDANCQHAINRSLLHLPNNSDQSWNSRSAASNATASGKRGVISALNGTGRLEAALAFSAGDNESEEALTPQARPLPIRPRQSV